MNEVPKLAGRYSKKNDPCNEPVLIIGNREFKVPQEVIESAFWEEAEAILKDIKASNPAEDHKWLHRKEDIKERVEAMKLAYRTLKSLTDAVSDDPGNPTIRVHEYRDMIEMDVILLRRAQEDKFTVTKDIRHVAGRLEWYTRCLEKFEPLPDKIPKYNQKIAGEQLADHYRRHGRKVDWGKIADMVLEKFPDTQGENSVNRGEWLRQLVKRKP